jgi:hypothetical protein
MDQTPAAKHSAAYRERQTEIKAKMGIETLKIEAPASVRSGMNIAMAEHGYSQVQELWQDLALSFLSMPREEQARRLRKPDTSPFVVTEKLARQLIDAGMAERGPHNL